MTLVPYLPEEVLRDHAARFLTKYHPSESVPVPIELIAERDLGIEIVPMRGILRARGINGFLSSDLKTIYVDEHLFYEWETRYAFTIAHEVGHLWMHRDYFRVFRSDEEWQEFHAALTSESLSTAEHQANSFAGRVLVPTRPLVDLGIESAKRLAARVREQYQGFDFTSDTFWSHVAHDLRRRFGAAEQTIRIRLEEERLWRRDPDQL